MRMWNVDPACMCRKHLLGEHVELHMFAGTILKGISIQGYLDKKLVEVHNIEKRHEMLVHEMEKRGYRHNSPLPYIAPVVNGFVDVEANKAELHKRCKDCHF